MPDNPLDARQIQLEQDLQVVPTIKTLKDGQEEMLKELRNDKNFNEKEFAKGTEKFKELSSELKEVRSEVSDMKTQISDGFKEMKDAITENEISKLKKELDKRDQEKQTQDNKSWDMAKIALTAIFAVISTALLFKFGVQ